jgi:hypothetical protein
MRRAGLHGDERDAFCIETANVAVSSSLAENGVALVARQRIEGDIFGKSGCAEHGGLGLGFRGRFSVKFVMAVIVVFLLLALLREFKRK